MSRNASPQRDPRTGTWWFIVDLAPGTDGRRRQAKRRGFRTKAEAQAALDELRVAARHGTYVAPDRQTIAEFLAVDWLPAVRRELAESTWESYARNVRLHVIPGLGGVRLQALDGGHLNTLYADLLAHGRKLGRQSTGLKPRTVRYIHTIIHAALDDAVKWRRLTVNPASQATPPSAKSAKPPEMKVWSAAELLTFLNLTDGDRYHYPWLVLATTGCRRGEVLGLRWQDIDLDEGITAIRQQVIPLQKAAGKGREGRIVSRTKGGDARVIELDRRTVATLRSWKARQAEEKLLLGNGYRDAGLVFPRPDGHPYHPEAFSKTFDRRLRQARFVELPLIRLHDLRHTWATLALKAGVDVKVVSERLGHSSPVITWTIYQHVVKGMQADAAERVAASIFGGLP
jgi:integrase